jgi:ketosteroid isomerase-like protein
MTVVAVCFLALLAVQCNQKPAPDTRAADEAAIRAMSPAWFKAYNAGGVDGIVALYTDDAILSPPGAPAARGHAAMREYLMKDVAAASSAGITLHGGPTTDVGISGDLGWESGTFTVTDKAGATVDKGKYVTVCERKNGEWIIIRDIWNSDGPMPK